MQPYSKRATYLYTVNTHHLQNYLISFRNDLVKWSTKRSTYVGSTFHSARKGAAITLHRANEMAIDFAEIYDLDQLLLDQKYK